MLNRRQFLQAAAASASAPALRAQTEAPSWGGPVIDIHFHARREAEGNAAHLAGCGVSNAILLTRQEQFEQSRALVASSSGRYAWSAAADITRPGAERVLTEAVKQGAVGFGEIKFHVAADGPELRRMYALAADLNVPILVHFQEVPHFDGEGVFSTGFQQFAAMLKAYPKTCFVGHADAFWANLSADYANQSAYPAGPVKRGGITETLLAKYPNLYGDLSANSGNNALSRDPEFTAGFLERHQDKLVFGSDCGCADGRGSGTGQPNNPAASRLAGKCVARETLALLKRSAPPEVFRKLTWTNAHRLYRLPA